LDKWKAEGNVEICGHVDVKPFLQRGGVFVLPSYYREGVPRSTQEAMAAGLPIITTDVPGCRETVVDGVNGFLVPAHNAKALAKAMKRFIVQPALIKSMGKESRRMAEERFDIHKVNLRLAESMGL
jgi:glycosyltransferase involved in cell wall biosynthesis